MTDWHIPLIVLLFIVLDVISGFAKAVKNREVSSEKMRLGAWHKSGFLLVIVFAYTCEYALNYVELGFQAPIVVPVCVFLILTEITSFLENVKELVPELADNKFMGLFGKND